MAALGARYLNGQDTPRRIAEGARLLHKAFERGALLDGWSCDVFFAGIGTHKDLALAFRCYLRAGDERASLMLVNGQGIERDVAVAAALLPKPNPDHSDCAGDLRTLIAREQEKPSKGKIHEVCEILFDSNFCGSRCQHTEELLRAWKAEQRLGKYTAKLSTAAKGKLEAVYRAAKQLAAAEGDLIYNEYIDGSARTELSAARESTIMAHFDHDLVALFEDKLPPADVKSLALMRRALKLADAPPKALGPGTTTRALRKKWRLARQRWRAYLHAWEQLVALVKPQARQALPQRLMPQLLYRCLYTPATTEQPRVLDAFVERLRRTTGCSKEQAAALRASLAAQE